jgi:glycine oxidase
MICFRPGAGRLFKKVIYTPRGYLVPRADGRILCGATVEDTGFNKAITSDGVAKLQQTAAEISPVFLSMEISDSWAGLRPASPDGLPILGDFSDIKGLTVTTGHYRNGILLAPITAEIIADCLVTGIKSEFLEIFGPQRFQVAATV